MSRYHRWVQSLSWPALTALVAVFIAVTFAINAAWWWAAQQLSWVAYAAVATVVTLGWVTVTSTVKVLRQRRRHQGFLQFDQLLKEIGKREGK